METAKSYGVARTSGWNVALGIWVLISPFVLGHTQHTSFLPNNVATGALIALFALIRSGKETAGGIRWANLILGLWLIGSPFALNFSHVMAPLWNNIICGIVVALIALAGAFTRHAVVTEAHAR